MMHDLVLLSIDHSHGLIHEPSSDYLALVSRSSVERQTPLIFRMHLHVHGLEASRLTNYSSSMGVSQLTMVGTTNDWPFVVPSANDSDLLPTLVGLNRVSLGKERPSGY